MDHGLAQILDQLHGRYEQAAILLEDAEAAGDYEELESMLDETGEFVQAQSAQHGKNVLFSRWSARFWMLTSEMYAQADEERTEELEYALQEYSYVGEKKPLDIFADLRESGWADSIYTFVVATGIEHVRTLVKYGSVLDSEERLGESDAALAKAYNISNNLVFFAATADDWESIRLIEAELNELAPLGPHVNVLERFTRDFRVREECLPTGHYLRENFTPFAQYRPENIWEYVRALPEMSADMLIDLSGGGNI